MEYKIKFNYLALALIIILFFTMGCNISIIPDVPSPSDEISGDSIVPTAGSIIIADGADITKDCTPPLAILSEGAAQMSFSGDGESWTEWIDYDTSYEEFNIANGLNGTDLSSEIKYVYVRFKDEEDNLYTSDQLASDTIEYEMGELYSIKIFPPEVTMPVGGNYKFNLHGYDLKLNEVPLDNSKVTWTKQCGVGNLSPTTGLSTTYTAPTIAGERNITAYYNNLQTGAVVIILSDD
ncbi:MAG TPA: hypothetical protein VFC91_06205 [Atribacterota bacterium]|nr:hypothetical protein [Atribacterota bacterium]